MASLTIATPDELLVGIFSFTHPKIDGRSMADYKEQFRMNVALMALDRTCRQIVTSTPSLWLHVNNFWNFSKLKAMVHSLSPGCLKNNLELVGLYGALLDVKMALSLVKSGGPLSLPHLKTIDLQVENAKSQRTEILELNDVLLSATAIDADDISAAPVVCHGCHSDCAVSYPTTFHELTGPQFELNCSDCDVKLPVLCATCWDASNENVRHFESEDSVYDDYFCYKCWFPCYLCHEFNQPGHE
ncbi:hypothetical protein HDU98_008538 [Podochytrium sp. JEL0797]|nr:hypothetical protein HDU98_008538 [Podochytrium sp. JEL0797]